MTASPTRRRARMRLTSRRAGALAAAVAAVLVATPMVSVASPAPARVAEITAGESAAVPDPEAEPADRADLGLVPVLEPAAPAIEPDRVLVRFAPGTSASAKRGSIEAADGTQDGAIGGTGFVAVETAPGEAADVAAELDADPSVADVQVDHVRASSGVEVWGGEEYLEHAWPYLELTTLPSAWESADGRGVTIAVLDTAIYTTHLELASRIVPGIDLVGGWMTNSHGTAVASVAAGGANGLGAVGAAYAASVMPVRVLDDSGQGTDSTIAAGIDWASSHGAKVINLSLGGPDPSLVLRAAMQTAVSRGSVVVVAAGNSGDDVPQYPAAYAAELPGVLSVASTNDDGETLPSSSGGDSVSLAAPGLDIIGAGANGTPWVSMSGTSVAAPFVSGAAALVIQKNPTWTPAQVSERLMATSRDAGPRGVDPYFGRGILDAGAALGQTPAVPLDRAVGDAGATDDLPSRAVAVSLPVTDAVVPLEAQGDADWRRFESVAGTDYEIVARPEYWSPLDLVVVLDKNGKEVHPEAQDLLGREHTYRSLAGGTMYVGVGPRAQDAEEIGVTLLTIRRAPTQRSTDFVLFDEPAAIAPTPSGLAGADLTGDGIEDRVGVGTWSDSLILWPGLASGADGPAVTLGIPTPDRQTIFTVPVNISGDAVPELFVVPGSAGAYVTSARGGSWAPLIPVGAVTENVRQVTTGDLDRDGDQDVVVTLWYQTLVFRNVGGELHQETLTSMAGTTVELLDLDGANGLDLVFDQGRTALQRPDGTFAPGPELGIYGGYESRVALIDDDALPDLLIQSGGNSETSIFYGKAGGGLSAPQPVHIPPASPRSLLLVDVNGDGHTDIVGRDWIVLQRSDRSFRAIQRQYLEIDGDVVKVRDLTGDGRPDLICSTRDSTLVVPQLGPDGDDTPGAAAWVWAVSPEAFATGVPARPDVQVTSTRSLARATGVTLVGSDGKSVAAGVTLDASGHTITLTPTADLVTGGHYEVLVTGLEDTDGDVMPDVVRSWFTVGAAGQRYTPVDPERWLDTRQGRGALRPGSPLDLSFDELPEDATAVVLNVTAAAPVGAGFVRVFPTPAVGVTTEPSTSSLNLANGIDQPNLVTVKLGRDRSVRISSIWTTTHIVVDLAGYYGAGGATAYVPLAPVRVMDNRTGEDGSFKGRISAGTYVDLQVAGKNGVPADASAVVLNVTGVNPPGRTTVRVYPTPEPFRNSWRPEVSNLNLMPGRDQPNLVTVKVGWNGKVRFYVHNTDMFLVADLAGYYSPTGANGFTAMDPVRLADTRTGLGLPGGRMVPTESRTLRVSGTHGIPADAKAAVLNVTGARPGYLTVIRVFPAGLAQLPSISNLNLVPGRDDPNMVISKIGTGGGVDFYTHSATTDLVVDVGGYFTTFR